MTAMLLVWGWAVKRPLKSPPKCHTCGRHVGYGSNGRRYCSLQCSNAGRIAAGLPPVEFHMSAAEVERTLADAVRMETADPWVKHR